MSFEIQEPSCLDRENVWAKWSLLFRHASTFFLKCQQTTAQNTLEKNQHPFVPTMASNNDYFGKISMEELDALSSDDDDSSNDEEEAPVRLSLPSQRPSLQRKTSIADFAGFEEGSDAEDPIAKQMQSILSLRLSLRMDDDKEFMEEQEKKKLEREKLAKMTPEERLRCEEEATGSLLSSVKSKFDIEAIRRRRMQQDETSSTAKLPAADKEAPSAELKECDTTASESGSLSDETADNALEKETRKKDKKHKKDSKHKKKKEEKKSKRKKKKKDGSEDKKDLLEHNKTHSNHHPKRVDAI